MYYLLVIYYAYIIFLIGLEYILPNLKENGITNPKKLAQLSLRDMYEIGKSI